MIKIIKENRRKPNKSSLSLYETLNTSFPIEARRKLKTPLVSNTKGFLFLPAPAGEGGVRC